VTRIAARVLPLLLVSALAGAASPAHALSELPKDPASCARIAFAPRALGAGTDHGDVTYPCPGVRPGGALVLYAGPLELAYCSMSFLVTDGTDVYVSTAGHCTLESLGAPDFGDPVYAHGVVGPIGELAYRWCEGGDAAGNGCGAGTDFALIRLNENGRANASPQMCTFTAPSGIFTARDSTVRELRHFGWGIGIGSPDVGVHAAGTRIMPGNPATQSRRSLGLDFELDSWVLGYGAAISGDSGSGVLVTEIPTLPSLAQPPAQALGVLTHIAAGGFIVVQRMDASLARAGTEMGRTFTLWTG